MTDYEIMFILKPHLSEEIYKTTVEQFQSWITKQGGEILSLSCLGMKELAQTFGKFNHGYYVQSQFKAGNPALEEIQRNISVSEIFMRHLIVTVESITIHKRPIDEKKKAKLAAKAERLAS